MIKSTLKLINIFSRKVRDDHVAAFSAQAAFFIIISFFPFLMLLLAIISQLSIKESTLLNLFYQIFPSAINSFVISIVDEIDSSASSGTLISITAITALWSAGKGFFAIMKGMNSVYEINETRKSIFLRLLSTIYTLIFAILLIASMVLLVFGNRLYIWIEQKFPVLKDLALLIISLRTIVGLIILLVFFLFIYVVIPNRKTRFINELPGALVSAGGWMAFSYAFSYYIDHYSNYASMYGSLTAIVLFMLWMYCCMYILFIGAEINLLVENKAVINKIKQLYKKDKAENIYK
jgi:membrane protein